MPEDVSSVNKESQSDNHPNQPSLDFKASQVISEELIVKASQDSASDGKTADQQQPEAQLATSPESPANITGNIKTNSTVPLKSHTITMSNEAFVVTESPVTILIMEYSWQDALLYHAGDDVVPQKYIRYSIKQNDTDKNRGSSTTTVLYDVTVTLVSDSASDDSTKSSSVNNRKLTSEIQQYLKKGKGNTNHIGFRTRSSLLAWVKSEHIKCIDAVTTRNSQNSYGQSDDWPIMNMKLMETVSSDSESVMAKQFDFQSGHGDLSEKAMLYLPEMLEVMDGYVRLG